MNISPQLPMHWEKTKLGNIATFVMGQAPPGDTCNFEQKGTPFVKAGEFGELRPVIREWTIKPLKMAARGDVLICVVGATSGKLNLGDDCAIGRSVAAIRPEGSISNTFLYKQLLLQVQALRQGSTGSAQGVISKVKLNKIEVVLPPLPEQKRIVTKIDVLQAKSKKAREALDAARPLLDKLRQSILAAAFRGDLTADWRKQNPDEEPASKMLERIRIERRQKWEEAELAKMRAKGKEPKNDKWKAKYNEPEQVDITDLPELPDGWCWVRLSECGEMARGKSKHRPRNDPRLFGGKYPFIQTGEVARSKGVIDKASKFYSNFGLAQSRIFPVGTVCITIAANIADTAVLGIESCFPDSVVGVIVDRALLSSSYLETYIRTIRSDLAAFAPATAQKNINLAILNEVAVPLPPTEEMEMIDLKIQQSMLFTEDIEKDLTKSVKALKKQDQSILAKAFRGELVPQEPNDEPAAILLERIKAKRALQNPKKGKKKTKKKGVVQ